MTEDDGDQTRLLHHICRKLTTLTQLISVKAYCRSGPEQQPGYVGASECLMQRARATNLFNTDNPAKRKMYTDYFLTFKFH